MKLLFAPAKNSKPVLKDGLSPTRPQHLAKTRELAELLKQCSAWELESLLRLNPEMAMRAFLAYQEFDLESPGTPAVLSYSGLAYRYLDAASLSREELLFAQDKLRILSALYGVLRPLDGILPHRLEYQCGFRPHGGSLYDYWGDDLPQSVYEEDPIVVNLASEEYARSVRTGFPKSGRFLTCVFLSVCKGRYRTIPTTAKMARGRMVRWIVRERLTVPESLQGFTGLGFRFSPPLSVDNRYVFLQDPQRETGFL